MLLPTPERRLPGLLALCLTLCLTGMAGTAHALPTDRDQPVKVAADSASFDQKTGIAVYTGNVFIQQGTLEVHADQVTVTVDKAGTVQSSVSIGKPAHYQQKTDEKRGVVNADADKIEYDVADQKMVLTGNAKLRQDTSSFAGSVITYLMDQQQVDATGDSKTRVTLVFPPQPRDTAASKDKPK